jgi:hypothetical protein
MGYSSSRLCTFSDDAFIVAMTGHFHARGDAFMVYWAGDDGTNYEQIYDSHSWDAPVFKIFDPPMLIGGRSQRLQFSCYYHNSTNDWIGFGGRADVQEHCNLFFQYYTTQNTYPLLTCTQGSGGW